MTLLTVAFSGASSGEWQVTRFDTIVGPALAETSHLHIAHDSSARVDGEDALWVLRGVTSNERYVTRAEHDALAARQEPLGRTGSTRAALIPITKTEAWWDLAQDERRRIFEESSHHVATGIEYLPQIARRLYHGRDLGEPFDFLTWFEFAPGDAAAFDELVGRLARPRNGRTSSGRSTFGSRDSVQRDVSEVPLYGPQQSRFARYLERREQRRPDEVARELRRRLLAGLRGRVIEVGCGDGRAFEHYPPEVERVLAVEPDPVARDVAGERARGARIPIEVVEGVAEALPAADEEFDAVVLMGVLCTVPDPDAALREVRRVLRPDGDVRFWEHVRSRNPAFRGVQRAADALFWTRSLGGCRTTRDSVGAIREAGFEIVELDRGFHSSTWLTITSAPYVLGVARRP